MIFTSDGLFMGTNCLAPWCQARMKADCLHYCTAKKAFLVVGQPKVRGTILGPGGKGGNGRMLAFLKKKRSELFRNKGNEALINSPSSPLLTLDLLFF